MALHANAAVINMKETAVVILGALPAAWIDIVRPVDIPSGGILAHTGGGTVGDVAF